MYNPWREKRRALFIFAQRHGLYINVSGKARKVQKMRYSILIIFIGLLFSCKERPTFKFETASGRLGKITKWNDKVIVEDNIGDLYEIFGDTLKRFKVDNIVSLTKCKNDFYILKAPNDTTLIISQSSKPDLVIKNRSSLLSKYFALRTNEKCEFLLEYGMAAFKIQENSFIDLNSLYGFKKNTSFNVSDKFGYFDNFIFLTKYANYSSGGVFQVYIGGDSTKYSLSKDLKVRDFTIHKDELWLVTGFYETIDDKHLVERDVLKIKDGLVEEVIIRGMADDMDIAAIYSNDNKIYFLSERYGFYELKNDELEEMISINLRDSEIQPESFIVQDNFIFLSTFENGVLKFAIKDKDFAVTQIMTKD